MSASAIKLVSALWRSLRPKQFLKNCLIFAPGIFSLRSSSSWILDGWVFGSLVTTFVMFTLLAGCTYIINDYVDLEKDRLNPAKNKRPMAAGQLNPSVALGFALPCIVAVLVIQFVARSPSVGWAFVLYLVVTLLYSFVLKHQVIIDIMVISFLFMLRGYLGCLSIGVQPSLWFLVCVGSIAMVVAGSKRHHEARLSKAQPSSEGFRAVIQHYNQDFLHFIVTLSTVSALCSYSLFTAWHAPKYFAASIPLVIYALLRFQYLALVRGVAGTPEVTLLRDPPLMMTLVVWTAMMVAIYALEFGNSKFPILTG